MDCFLGQHGRPLTLLPLGDEQKRITQPGQASPTKMPRTTITHCQNLLMDSERGLDSCMRTESEGLAGATTMQSLPEVCTRPLCHMYSVQSAIDEFLLGHGHMGHALVQARDGTHSSRLLRQAQPLSTLWLHGKALLPQQLHQAYRLPQASQASTMLLQSFNEPSHLCNTADAALSMP